MYILKYIVIIAAVITSITMSVFAVTPKQISDNLEWLVSDHTTPKLRGQLRGMFFNIKKRENGHIDLRSKCNKKIRVRLACLQGQLGSNSFDRNAITAAWSLVSHYRKIDHKVYSIGKNKSFDESFQRNTDCFVCQDQAQSPISLACGHVFCSECLLQWFAQKPMNKVGLHHQCPACRFDFEINLKNFLLNHPDYQALVEKSLQNYEEEDYKELMNEQSEFDLDFIQNNLLSQEEYELLVKMQAEFDKKNNQYNPEKLDEVLQYLKNNDEKEQDSEVPMLVEDSNQNENISNLTEKDDENDHLDKDSQEYSDDETNFLAFAMNTIFNE